MPIPGTGTGTDFISTFSTFCDKNSKYVRASHKNVYKYVTMNRPTHLKTSSYISDLSQPYTHTQLRHNSLSKWSNSGTSPEQLLPKGLFRYRDLRSRTGNSLFPEPVSEPVEPLKLYYVRCYDNWQRVVGFTRAGSMDRSLAASKSGANDCGSVSVVGFDSCKNTPLFEVV